MDPESVDFKSTNMYAAIEAALNAFNNHDAASSA